MHKKLHPYLTGTKEKGEFAGETSTWLDVTTNTPAQPNFDFFSFLMVRKSLIPYTMIPRMPVQMHIV